MKKYVLVVLVGSLLANTAFAECKSVMGACPTQEMVNSAPHMHSEYVAKTKVKKAPVANKVVMDKNAKKPSTTGVYSTMQK